MLVGFQHLYEKRDRHFGNGRLARNAFEDSVRRLADRIAEVTQLTETLLTSLNDEDISMPGISQSALADLLAEPRTLRVACEGCKRRIRISPMSLGSQIKCTKCGHIQSHDWATISDS